MPTSKHRKHRSPKPSQMPAKTTNITSKIVPAAPIQSHDPPSVLLELAEMNGNEREIDLSALSPRQQAALPIVAGSPTIVQAARAAGVGESTLRRWLTDPAFSNCLAELRRQSANLAVRNSWNSPRSASPSSPTPCKIPTRPSVSAPQTTPCPSTSAPPNSKTSAPTSTASKPPSASTNNPDAYRTRLAQPVIANVTVQVSGTHLKPKPSYRTQTVIPAKAGIQEACQPATVNKAKISWIPDQILLIL